jgi:hypothetical protein
MLNLPTTGTKLRVTTGSAGTIYSQYSYVDDLTTGPTFTPGGAINAVISTATTIDLVPVPASNTVRNVTGIIIANTDASVSNAITVVATDGTSTFAIWAGTLLAGQKVVMNENGDWTLYGSDGRPYTAATRLDALLRVVSDVTNATTSFADVTGLTVALLSGRKYAFEGWLMHSTNATTTGARYGVNIGATPTSLVAAGQHQLTSPGVATAATYVEGAPITALDTAFVAETTGPGTTLMQVRFNGLIVPSADGTFALRSQSEVAVAGGLVTKAGSWMRVTECDN